jgi:predicted transporter
MADHLTLAAVILGGTFAALYVMWVVYLAVMNLARAKHAGLLSRTARVLGTPLLIFGLVLDAFLNWTFLTVLLLELPQEATMSERLERHNRFSLGWRKSVAVWAEQLLDPYDPDEDHI